MTSGKWNELAEYLKKVSGDVCKLNNCTDEDHSCQSYAYIDINGDVWDVCAPDYFQGGHNIAAIPLPFDGSGDDLEDEVLDQTYDTTDILMG